MLLSGCFRHQQAQQHRHWLPVGRVERNGLGQADECRQRLFQSFHAAMRNGHALPKGSGAKTFPGKEAVEHEGACQAVVVFKKQASLFERTFLARCEHIEHDVAGG
ncbi:hypothetical protein D3C77_591140 [compost metagenome]